MNIKDIQSGPEEKALLLLSGLKPLPAAREAVAQIVNWERFVWLANEHGVAGFVKQNLKALELTSLLPPTEYQKLRNQAFKGVVRNSFIMTALAEATTVLNGAGIIPVLLKGTALEGTVYGNSGLRPLTDADILLSPEECLKGWSLLQKHGFEPLPFKSPLYKLIPLYIGKHLPSLIKGGFSLEIHHSLFWGNGSHLTEKLISESLEPTPGTGYRVPGTGLHFLYLVSHLAKHELNSESQLRLYNDLAGMLNHYGAKGVIDEAMVYAREAGMEEVVKTKLAILHRYLGVALPDGIDYVLSAKAEASFLSFLANPKNNVPVNKQKFYRESVRAVRGLHRKIIYLVGDIFPGFRFMKKRYGKRYAISVMPYYLMRVGKLLWLI